MESDGHSVWRQVVKRALEDQDISQAALARTLNVKPGQVSDWLSGAHWPRSETRRAISQELKIASDPRRVGEVEPVDRRDIASRLYVSSPITAIAKDKHQEHYDQVSRIVEAASEVVDEVHWPGGKVVTRNHLRAAGVATRENFDWLATAGGLLYVQFAELEAASGALVELGISLGRKLRTTVILIESVHKPFMLTQGFEALASAREDLPNALLYTYESVDDAVGQITETGAEYFGLPRAQDPSKLF